MNVTRIGSLIFAVCAFLESSPTLAGDLKEVKFRMEWIPSGMYAPMYEAQSSGIFREQGLTVDMLAGSGGLAAVADVAAGHSDLGMASCGTLAIAIGNGRPVVSVAEYLAKYDLAFFVPKSESLTSIKQLIGKSIVVSPNASDALLLPALYKSAGLPDSALRTISVDPSQKIATYLRGQADTVATSVAFGAPMIDKAKPSDMFLWSKAGFSMPDYCVFSRRETLEKNPELISSFLKALFKGVSASLQDPSAAAEATVKANPLLDHATTLKQWQLTTRFLKSDSARSCDVGWHARSDWTAGLNILKKYAGLQGDVADHNRFYTNKFIHQCGDAAQQ